MSTDPLVTSLGDLDSVGQGKVRISSFYKASQLIVMVSQWGEQGCGVDLNPSSSIDLTFWVCLLICQMGIASLPHWVAGRIHQVSLASAKCSINVRIFFLFLSQNTLCLDVYVPTLPGYSWLAHSFDELIEIIEPNWGLRHDVLLCGGQEALLSTMVRMYIKSCQINTLDAMRTLVEKKQLVVLNSLEMVPSYGNLSLPVNDLVV